MGCLWTQLLYLRKINGMKKYFVISVNGHVDGLITNSHNNWLSIKNKKEPLVKEYINITHSVDINTFVKVCNNHFTVEDEINKKPIAINIKNVNLWTEEDITNY